MSKKAQAKNRKAKVKEPIYMLRMWKEQIRILPALIGIGIVASASALLSIYAPTQLGQAVDVITGVSNKSLRDTIFILILFYTLALFANIIQEVALNNVMTRVVTQGYRVRISRSIKSLPVSFVDSNPYGEILSKTTDDVSMLGGAVSTLVRNGISGLAQIVGVMVILFIINPWLPLVVLGLGVVTMVLGGVFFSKIGKHFDSIHENTGLLNAHITESFSSHDVIKAYNLQNYSADKFKQLNSNLRNSAYKAFSLGALGIPILTILNAFALIAVCIFSAYLAIHDKITVGDVLTITMLSRMVTGPLVSLIEMLNHYQRARGGAKRVYGIVDATQMTPDKTTYQINDLVESIELKDISFRYVENVSVIENLNVTIKKGKKVAIVGPTGCGKTTLVNLLMRFYDANSGDILIDGKSIYETTRAEIRNVFGMVLQDVWLFNGTIRDNIAYGKQNASDKEIELACSKAHIDRFINTLPEGYSTLINEDATNISQGQKQLITIARAFLADKPILILDEATSNVDTLTEQLVQDAMVQLLRDKTSFVIAHRLSTIVDSDIILVMNDGQIIEQGTHSSLLAQKGFYANLYNSQFILG